MQTKLTAAGSARPLLLLLLPGNCRRRSVAAPFPDVAVSCAQITPGVVGALARHIKMEPCSVFRLLILIPLRSKQRPAVKGPIFFKRKMKIQ